MGRMLKVNQVAERVNAHPETVRRWLREGTLRGVLIGGTTRGNWRVDEDEVERYLHGREAKEERGE